MRICLVSRELAPFFGGGIGTYISHASRALAEAGHEVHILTDRHPRLEGVSWPFVVIHRAANAA